MGHEQRCARDNGAYALSGEVSYTNSGAAELARTKIKAREDGIRANAIKQGRELERNDLLKEFGAQTLGELSVLNHTIADNDLRWQREERKEAKGAFWRGATIGAAIGAAFVSVGYLMVVGEAMRQAFDRAQEMTAQTLAIRMVQLQAGEEVQAHEAGVDRNPLSGRRLPEPASAP